MKFWNPYPMARLLIPFVGGILIAPYLKFSIAPTILFVSILFMLLFLWIFILKKHHTYRLRWLSGFMINAVLFLIGIITIWEFTPSNKKNHYSNFKKSDSYLIEINSALIETEKSIKTSGEIVAIYSSEDSVWEASSGQIVIYFQKQEKINLSYGDKIVSTALLNPISGPQNPFAFDYRNYLALKGIYHQSYLKDKDWILVEPASGFNLFVFANNLRNTLLDLLKKQNYDENTLAVAAALLLGYDEYLDDELRANFSGSGAMHILCVSGLHVGIVYIIANFLLGFLGYLKYGNALKTGLILGIIWIYAMITGLAPSVMRASFMFSFIIVAQAVRRKGNTYNSLAASAFILLLINPNFIYNIGFQLSYSAVFAILFIQPQLSQFLKIKNSFLKNIGDLITVSIAAQLGTFPFAVYYFHQFPNYFLLTNLWVIPLSFIVLCAGIAVLLIGISGFSLGIIGSLTSALLLYSVKILNKGVELMNNLPYAVLENLVLSRLQLFLLYFIVLGLSMLWLYKKREWLLPLLFSMLLFVSDSLLQSIISSNSNTFIVYKTTQYSAMDFISAQKNMLLGDSAFINDKQKQKFVLKENHVKSRIEELAVQQTGTTPLSCDYLYKEDNLILFQSLRILFIDKQLTPKITPKPLGIDFVVVAKNTKINLPDLLSQYRFKCLIFDSSNTWWKIKKLKEEAAKLEIEIWDVNEKGAFVFIEKKSPLKHFNELN
jgi:competence protein ComEC